MIEDLDYTNYPVLIVDDETDVLNSMISFFEDIFTIHGTDDPEKALTMVKEKEYAVVMADQKMPKMKGFELLTKIKEDSPQTIRVLITGYPDVEAAIEAVGKDEIFSYIPKKTSRKEKEILIKRAIQWYHLHKEMKRLRQLEVLAKTM